jgi:hypothetical protein
MQEEEEVIEKGMDGKMGKGKWKKRIGGRFGLE